MGSCFLEIIFYCRSESDTKGPDEVGDVNENDTFDTDEILHKGDNDSENNSVVVNQVDTIVEAMETQEDEQTYYRTQGGQMLPINVKVSFQIPSVEFWKKN